MTKRKVTAFIMAIAMTLTVLSTYNVKAETVSNEGIEIDFGEFELVTSDYSKDEVEVKTIKNTDDEKKINIVDKETGLVVETITCTSIPEDSPKMKSLLSNGIARAGANEFYYTIQRDKSDRLVTVRLETVVILYRSGSFSSIQSIEGTNMYPITTSTATLENVSTYARSMTGSFPTTHIEYLGNGVITIATQKTVGNELSIGFTIEEVVNFGYSVSTSSTSTVYLRKPISIQGEYKTYATPPTPVPTR